VQLDLKEFGGNAATASILPVIGTEHRRTRTNSGPRTMQATYPGLGDGRKCPIGKQKAQNPRGCGALWRLSLMQAHSSPRRDRAPLRAVAGAGGGGPPPPKRCR
jgi:hypothetical protein